MPKITVSDGVEINYYLDDYTPPWEESETIVMCHGAGSNAKLGLLVAGHLATTYRVIRIDERGMGESSLPPGVKYVPSIERFAEDALNVIDALGVKKIYWFGFFSGGWNGMQFSTMWPDRIKAMVLCTVPSASPVHFYSEITKGGERGARSTAVGMDPWVTPKMAEWEINERVKNRPDIVAARWEYSRHTRGESGYSVPALLTKIPVPVLLITGSDCDRVSPELILQMRKQIPNAQVTILENTGCCSFYTAPERVAEAAINFLKELKKRNR